MPFHPSYDPPRPFAPYSLEFHFWLAEIGYTRGTSRWHVTWHAHAIANAIGWASRV